MFDPYHKWLGIPKDQRPPTFYQLLGISPDETDLEVIEEAAIRQTTYLRGYQIGPHAQECTRLLNEIALARGTLLNAAKRADYDAKIKPIAQEAPNFTGQQSEDPWTESVAAKGPPSLPGTAKPSKSALKKKWGPGIAIGAALHLIGISVLLYYFVFRPRGAEPQEARNHHSTEEVKPNAVGPGPAQPKTGQQLTSKPKTEPIRKPMEPAPPPVRNNPPPPPPPDNDPPASPDEFRRFKGHVGHVQAVAFSPDVRRVVTGSSDNTLRLWEVETGKAERVFKGHTDAVRCLAVSSDGRQILSGSKDGTVRLWDLEAGDQLIRLDGHANDVTGVAFLGDGKQALSCSRDKTIRVWDLAARRQVNQHQDARTAFECMALSNDGRLLLTGGTTGSLQLWDVAGLKVVKRFLGQAGLITGVALTGDGRQALSAGTDGTVRLWDVDTRRQIHRFSGT
jgi:hypothetical protein